MKQLAILLFLVGSWAACKITQQHRSLEPQTVGVAAYTPTAVSITSEGGTHLGPSAISAYWRTLFGDISFVGRKIIKQVAVGRNDEYTYEISRFKDDDRRAFAQLIVWDNQQRDTLRTLEFLAAYDQPITDLREIEEARTRWMTYCNAHDVRQLIGEVYTLNTFYYNHRPLLQGRSALEKEYAYMKNPNYSLTLTPLHVEPVTDSLVLELGQCSGSYGGKYLIVWQKQPSGNWQVLLDGNL